MILKLLSTPLYGYLSLLGSISNATGWRSPNDPKNPYRINKSDRNVIEEPFDHEKYWNDR